VGGSVVCSTQELQTAAAVGFVSGCSLFSASGTVLFWGQFTAREEIGTLRHN
jgi:hypothetical protein